MLFYRSLKGHLLEHGLRVDFSKGESVGQLTGIFNETGVIGMLEPSNQEERGMMFPSIGVKVDRLCSIACGSIKKTFTLYVDLLNFVYYGR